MTDKESVMSRSLYIIVGLGFLVSLALGCSKPCEEFAERVCERSNDDLADCRPDETNKLSERCTKMRAIVASCRELKEQAAAASSADNAQCEANLELLSALERQQQQR